MQSFPTSLPRHDLDSTSKVGYNAAVSKQGSRASDAKARM